MSLTGKDIADTVKKHPVGVGCALLSVILLGFLYLRSGAIDEIQARLDELTAQGERIKGNIRYSAQLDKQLAAVGGVLDTLSERAVHAGKLAQNLQYFYKLESDSGAALIDLRQQNTISPPVPKNAPAAAFNSLPFNVGVQGGFDAVMRFLRKLENGEHFSRITGASLRPVGSEKSDLNRVTLNISVELLGEP